MKTLISLLLCLLVSLPSQASRAFSGTTNKVTVNGNSAVNIFTGPFTLAFWVFPTSTASAYPVGKWVDGSGNVNQQYLATLNDINTGTNKFGDMIGSFSAISGWYGGCGTISANHWYHVTIRLDPAGIIFGGPAYAINVGGFSGCQSFAGATGERRSSSTSSLLMGCGHGTLTTTCLQGYLCDVAIWTVPLNDTELGALNNGVAAGRIRRSAQVFYMPLFGETSPEGEFSGNALLGTLTGTSQGQGCPVGKTF